MILTLLLHDLTIHFRSGYRLLAPSLVALILAAFFPLLLPATIHMTHAFLHPLLGVCALFSALLTIPLLWEEDEGDGTMTLYFNLKLPFALIFFTKICLHFVIAFLPILTTTCLILLLSPLPHPGLMLGPILCIMLCTMLLLSLLSTLIGLLTLDIKRGGGLVALLALPLMLPPLLPLSQLFASGSASTLASDPTLLLPVLWSLAGGLAILLPLGIWLGGWLVKLHSVL